MFQLIYHLSIGWYNNNFISYKIYHLINDELAHVDIHIRIPIVLFDKYLIY